MTPTPTHPGSGRKTKRKLTAFLAKEMLYDYAIGALDSERHTAVEKVLEEDRECREILSLITDALEYTKDLSRTELPESAMEALKDSDNLVSIGRKYSSWKAWPDSFRWSLTALLVSAAVAAMVIFVPWSRIPISTLFPKMKPSNQVEVAKIEKPNVPESPEAAADAKSTDDEEANDEAAAAVAANETSGDEYGDEGGDSGEQPPADLAKPALADTVTAAATASDGAFSGRVVPEMRAAKPAVQAAKPTPPVQAKAAQPPSAKPSVPQNPGKHPAGFVYRAYMTLENLEDVAPEINQKIFALGGEKAGEVEIGWKRGNGRYYHFVLPEENQQKLIEQLQVYGPVRISKDPHPRVMPQGQVRFILWIESSN